MEKSKFVGKYKLSEEKPINPFARPMSVLVFTEVLEKFLDSNFRGCVAVESDVDSPRYMEISEEYLIYFFKKLLIDLFGRVFIKVSVALEHTDYVIRIESDERLPLTKNETRELIKIARSAWMEIIPEERKITLKAKTTPSKVLSLYEENVRKSLLKNRFITMFFTIE